MSTIDISPANGTKNLAAGKYSIVYQAPVGCKSATVNVRMVSQDLTQNIKTRLAATLVLPAGWVADGAIPPTSDDWISPVDMILGPNGVPSGIIEDTAVVLSPGEMIIAYADTALCTCRVHGLVRTVI